MNNKIYKLYIDKLLEAGSGALLELYIKEISRKIREMYGKGEDTLSVTIKKD